jgi:uncharacterized membrane protein
MVAESQLHPLQRAFSILLGVVAVGGSIWVGVTPGGWDVLGGFGMGFIMAYISLRRVIEESLTELQRWIFFAFFGIGCFAIATIHASIEGNHVSDELFLSVVTCLIVAIGFGYRAMVSQ